MLLVLRVDGDGSFTEMGSPGWLRVRGYHASSFGRVKCGMHADVRVEMLTGSWICGTTVQGQGWGWTHALDDAFEDHEPD